MTVQEAHKEYNSLTDQIQATYEQLDSGECGSVDTPAFKAEACELVHNPFIPINRLKFVAMHPFSSVRITE